MSELTTAFSGQINRESRQSFYEALQPGIYWAGDLCYVLGRRDDLWSRMCQLIFANSLDDENGLNINHRIEGEFCIDGFRYAQYSTKWGDGAYPGKWNQYRSKYNPFEFSVDSGTLGIAPIEWLIELGLPDIPEDPDGKEYNFGVFYNFEYPFRTHKVDGLIKFGSLEINTDEEEEEEYEDWSR
jgi:hypothetical protein